MPEPRELPQRVTATVSPTVSSLVTFLQRGKPLRRLPVWSRYLIATAIVLVCFAIRYWLGTIYPYPYLVFLLGVLLTSFLLDRGSGFLATAESALLAAYFFVEPYNSFQIADVGPALSVLLFLTVGWLAASIIEALRVSVEELALATTDLAESRDQLGRNLSILETVLESTPQPVYVKDLEGRYISMNAATAQILGVAPAGAIGRSPRDFLRQDEAEDLERVDRLVVETRAAVAMDHLLTLPNQERRWFRMTVAPWYGPDGSIAGVVKIAGDIHEHKTIEEMRRLSTEQKELLLHDLNHRVKNHLQSIMSALGMSRRAVPDETARQALDDAISRLSVLARVYDRLELKEGGEAVVSARDFVEGLCDDLQHAIVGLRPIALRVRAAHVELPLDRAVPLGLIINEALTNAVKYAFPEERAGAVEVTFEVRDGEYCLEVADDGLGTPPERIGSGIGTKLIRALAQQLKGTVQWDTGSGTQLVVHFPIDA